MLEKTNLQLASFRQFVLLDAYSLGQDFVASTFGLHELKPIEVIQALSFRLHLHPLGPSRFSPFGSDLFVFPCLPDNFGAGREREGHLQWSQVQVLDSVGLTADSRTGSIDQDLKSERVY